MALDVNKPDQIIVHHDGVSREGPSFAIVNEFHKSRDFPLSSLGFYCGYHYWIERDGQVIAAREETEEGAHTVGQNRTSIGIGLAGNFDVEMPTEAQVEALGGLLSVYCRGYNIPPDRIFPHRHYAGKSCYGTLLSDNWAASVYLRHEIRRLTGWLETLKNPDS